MRDRIFISLAAALLLTACGSEADEQVSPPGGGAAMRLTSTAFAPGQTIPDEFTCSGADTSPPLIWGDPPAGTKSFAIMVEDPDAPGGIFQHWSAYNIPADRRELASGAGSGVSSGFAQAENDFGKAGYGGPCPPPGDQPHRYAFRVLALDVERLPGSAAHAASLVDAVDGHVLGSADLVGRFGR